MILWFYLLLIVISYYYYYHVIIHTYANNTHFIHLKKYIFIFIIFPKLIIQLFSISIYLPPLIPLTLFSYIYSILPYIISHSPLSSIFLSCSLLIVHIHSFRLYSSIPSPIISSSKFYPQLFSSYILTLHNQPCTLSILSSSSQGHLQLSYLSIIAYTFLIMDLLINKAYYF